MSDMLSKIKETGVNIKFIMLLPSVWSSVLLIFFAVVLGVVSNNWYDFLICLSIMLAWMLGVFFGFKMLLIKISEIDKESSNEQGG